MGKHAQIIMGPAGSGKSTYCEAIEKHAQAAKRTVHVVNLDPAAEAFSYNCKIDIRSLITVSDAMEEFGLGPNGALVYCMEYLVDNLSWLADQVADFGDDYLIFDCPGQVELYSHLPVMKVIVSSLEKWGYQVCGVYLLDSLLLTDYARFIAGSLMALSAMVQLELPHVNVLSKCDMVQDKKLLDRFLEADYENLEEELSDSLPPRFRALNLAMTNLLSSYGLVSFVPLDVSSRSSLEYLLATIDTTIQYGEDLEPKEPDDNENENESEAQCRDEQQDDEQES